MFDRANHIAASHADEFLKTISVAADMTTGNVEAPTGWVGCLEIDRDDIAAWVAKEGDPWISEVRNFAPGWYLVKVDNNGLVWGHWYASAIPALADFDLIEKAYAEWEDAD